MNRKLLGFSLIVFGLFLIPSILKITTSMGGNLNNNMNLGIIFLEVILTFLGGFLLFTEFKVKRKIIVNKTLKKSIIMILSMILFLSFLEVIFFLLDKFDSTPKVDEKYKIDNEKTCTNGYAPKSVTKLRLKRLSNGTIMYNVTYNIDSLGRRVNPQKINKSKLILFGGSFTFGSGIRDNETLSYFLSELSDYEVYNYAYPGYGTQHMLAQLQEKDSYEELSGMENIVIYVFIEHHIRRVIGAMEIYNQFRTSGMPYYYLNSNDELIKDGCLSTAKPFNKLIYNILSKSNTLEFLQFNLPPNKKEHLYLTYRIIEESKNIIESELGGTFYVLIHPLDKKILKDTLREYFIDLLKSGNISIIEIEIENKERLTIPLDGHPTSKANKIIAGSILEII